MFTKVVRGPGLAIEISVIIVFLGALAVETLPISQFPSIAPPSVVVAVSYPGSANHTAANHIYGQRGSFD